MQNEGTRPAEKEPIPRPDNIIPPLHVAVLATKK